MKSGVSFKSEQAMTDMVPAMSEMLNLLKIYFFMILFLTS